MEASSKQVTSLKEQLEVAEQVTSPDPPEPPLPDPSRSPRSPTISYDFLRHLTISYDLLRHLTISYDLASPLAEQEKQLEVEAAREPVQALTEQLALLMEASEAKVRAL